MVITMKKKSLAILIGVSDYDDVDLSLPPCANDVELMEKVVQFGGRFNDIIRIPSADAAALRNSLAETVQRFELEEIETLLFYFSGHGEYTADSFRLLLKDFSKNRASSTSLAMTDLDLMFRSLNPETMVKIIDACYSGAPIIKNSDQLKDNLFENGLFKNCYFLFSSHSDQRSFADIGLSDFTRNIGKAIADSKVPEIRFQQLMSYLTDAFVDNPRQTPMFVTQGSGVHSLGDYSEEAQKNIRQRVDSTEVEPFVSVPGDVSEIKVAVTPSLFERASLQSQKYVSHDTAVKLVCKVRDELDTVEIDERFKGMYRPSIKFDFDPNVVPFRKAVGIWLHNNAASEYFMVPDYYEEEYEVPLSEFDLAHIFKKKRMRTRSVVHGFSTELHGLPFVVASLEMEPELENLKKYGMWLTFAVSKTHITFFYAFVDYLEKGWGHYSPGDPRGCTSQTYSLTKTGPQKMVISIVEAFMDWVQDRVEAELDRQEFN